VSKLNYQEALPSLRQAAILSACLALFLCGCNRDEIRTYKVPKESAIQANVATPLPDTTVPTRPAPPAFKIPSGWKELEPTGMRVAAFHIEDQTGHKADISITPLGGVAGVEMESVNMWREALSLPRVSPEEFAKSGDAVQIGTAQGKLYEISGTRDSRQEAVTGAIVPAQGSLWFFKMGGDPTMVATEKAHFIEFLKSIEFPAQATTRPMVADGSSVPLSTNPRKTPSTATTSPLPEGWVEQAAPPMVLTSYRVNGASGKKADVTISMLPGPAGGTLGNVNRWRGQLSLPPIEDQELAGLTSTLDVKSGKATVVEMKGTSAKTGLEARLVAAIVNKDGNSWFYKFMGDDAVVTEQKSTFLKFVQSSQ
jgi:hypothetical protein